MQAELRALVSRTISDVWQERGQTALCFSHGAVLNVGGPHRLEPCAVGALTGQRLVSISAGTSRIALGFSRGASLLVCIQPRDSGHPSGICLTTRGGRKVEWPEPERPAAARPDNLRRLA